MDSYSNYNCWEIMNCDNLDCPARHDHETPCWEIAKREGAYPNVAKKCQDCIVYLLKAEAPIVRIKRLKHLIRQEKFWEDIEARHQNCIV